MFTAGCLALMAVAPLSAQDRRPTTPPHQGQPAPRAQPQTQHQQMMQQQMQRDQEMLRNMERVSAQIRETNQWMAQNRMQQQYREIGEGLQGTADRLQTMQRTATRMRADAAAQLTPDRVQDRDRLQEHERLHQLDRLCDQLQDMQRDMEQAHDALRLMVGKP